MLLYLDYTVRIPDAEGKIIRRTVKNTTYVYYEYDRTYDPKKQYTNVSRVTIGKVSPSDCRMMIPNQNYLTYFPDEVFLTIAPGKSASVIYNLSVNDRGINVFL